eukprot:scaffold40042_cov35-Tisochrysis_lutea.AAC.2
MNAPEARFMRNDNTSMRMALTARVRRFQATNAQVSAAGPLDPAWRQASAAVTAAMRSREAQQFDPK